MTIRAMDGVPTPIIYLAGPTRAGQRNTTPTKVPRSRRSPALAACTMPFFVIDGMGRENFLVHSFKGPYQSSEVLLPPSPQTPLPCNNIPGQRGIGLSGGSHAQ